MKVLALTPDYPPRPGGIQLLMHRVVTQMKGVEVRVVAPDAVGAAAFDKRYRPRVQRVRTPDGPSSLRAGALNAAGVIEGLRFRPDVVLSGHIVTSPAARAIAALTRAPYAQYLYASEVQARPGLARFAVARADAVVAISAHTRQLALGVTTDPKKVHVVHPGVDSPERVDDEQLPTPTLLTTSRLAERYKGHDVMIRALPLIRARVPDVHWVVIGDGPLQAHLQDLAAAHGLNGTVSWLGQVSDTERDRWLQRAHLLVTPSRVARDGAGGEGFGIACMEASASGLAVVAGDAGGTRDSVVDGETGLLVDARDPVAIADAVVSLLTDPRRTREMGKRGVRRAGDFGWDVIAERLRRVLEQIAVRGHGRSR